MTKSQLFICNNVTVWLISRKEKEKLVIQLANEGKTTREIAKQVHISLKAIGTIIRKVTEGDDALIEKEKQKKEAEEEK